ncbi:amidohydrolase [Candidatus Bathyarchaeota archaeon]|nr:MAG: amidohydrolase [Candidatus Bathyarchaeota archaeon]
MGKYDETYKRIREAVYSVRLIDTHEHLVQEKERLASKPDLFETILQHYLSSDLVSSGLSMKDLEELRNPNLPLTERWEIFKPFWENVQNTGYAWALKIAFRDLYGIDELTDETYMTLAKAMEERNKPGLYEWVLREKAGIERIILDTSTDTPVEEVDRRFFSPVIRFRDFVMVKSRVELEALETRCGRKIHSLNDLVDSLKAEFRRVYPHVVGVKIGLAYMRTLKFDKVSFREAEEVFNNIYKQEMFDRITIGKTRRTVPAGLSLNECKPLQDFMVHKVIQFASEMDLPIQIHTGLQEGNENIITNSNPTLLVNLFREYKEVKFDIFHGSYPYIGELAALAKNFPNVYVDMCWLHIISPYKAREALSEWLDTVPSNKIFGFGGDYRFIEGVYGHSVIARENIAKVLADKVAEGILTDEQAMKIAEKLLRKNAEELFLKKRV